MHQRGQTPAIVAAPQVEIETLPIDGVAIILEAPQETITQDRWVDILENPGNGQEIISPKNYLEQSRKTHPEFSSPNPDSPER